MNRHPNGAVARRPVTPRVMIGLAALVVAFALPGTASAQELRYSWFELGFVGQDVSRTASAFDLDLNQSVDINAKDGTGVRFRGSLGRWFGFYGLFDFTTSDPDVDAVVTNPQGEFPASDSFDFTQIRAGVGYTVELGIRTHVVGELTYDSVDYDFGSFAGENFDFDDQDIGAALGVRSLLTDDFEVRAFARYTGVGDVNLTDKVFDTDVLFSVGAGYELVRGLSVNFEYETGEVETWLIGFRLDLDED